MPISPRILKGSSFTPRSISGLALWLDASDTQGLYTTDAGPVTAVSSPLDIAGCQLWLDASDPASITASSGEVTAWADKSATGSSWTRVGGANGPATGTQTMGGKNVVVFDGTNDSLSASAPLNTSMPLTFFVVHRVVSATFIGMTYSVGDADSFSIRQSNVGNGNLQVTAGNGTVIGDGGAQVGQNLIHSWTVPVSGSSEWRTNGGGLAVTGTNLKPTLTGTHYLGRRGGATGYYANVQIAEIIVFNTALSTTDRARVESYLASKWGIAGVHTPATTAGDPVGYWRDRSGNGRHAVQATAASRPTVSMAAINSRNTLLLDGSNDWLNLGNLASAFPSEATLFVACAPQVGAGATTAWSTFSTGGNSWEQYPPGVTYSSVFRAVRIPAAATVLPYNGAAYQGSSIIIRHRSSSSGWGQFVNGGVSHIAAAGYSAAVNNSAVGYTIGADTSGGITNGPFKGRICEVLAYNKSLSDSQCERIEQWLSQKWSASFGPRVSHPDAQDWIRRVYLSNGTVSAATAAAVNQFCVDCESAGIRDRFYRLNLFCGTGLNACLVPLYRGASLGGTQYGNATDTNTGPFVSGDYSETGASGGLTGNGSSKYLNTGLAPSALPDYSTGHLSVYAKTGFGGSTIYGLLSSLGTGYAENYSIEANRSPGGLYGAWGKGGSFTALATSAQGAGAGHVVVARESGTSLTAYKNGSLLATSTTSVTPAANAFPIFVFAHNNIGSGVLNHASALLGGYSIGASLSESQAAAYYNAMQTFQTALTRNV